MISATTKSAAALLADESGVSAIEYGMLAATMAVGVTALVGTVGDPTSIVGRLLTKFGSILS